MSKSRDIADSAATINYIDGLTSDAQTQLDAAAAGGGSWTLIETLSPSAASTIDVESFDSTYQIYKIIYRLDPDAAVLPRIQLKFSGAYQTTAEYRGLFIEFSSANGTAYAAHRDLSTNYLQMGSSTSDTIHCLEIMFHNSNETSGYKNIYVDFRADKSTSAQQMIGSARWHNGTTGFGVLEGIRVFPNSGTYTGKVYVYGLNATGA